MARSQNKHGTITDGVIWQQLLLFFFPIWFGSFFQQLYNTTDEVKELTTFFIIFSAFMMPFNAFLHSTYFTLRSGGKTLITFFFDAGFVWIVSIPLAMMLSRLTDMPVRVLYACCTGADLIKVVIGYILVKRGKWVVKIVDND